LSTEENIKTMKILIKGFFGKNNIGDEAILDSMISSLKSEFPSSDIAVFTNNPRFTAEKYNVRPILNNWKKSYRVMLRETTKADIFILGGGGLFPNDTPIKIFHSLLFLPIAKIFGTKKIIIYSIGVDPIRYRLSRLLMKIFLNNFADEISTRDIESAEELRKCGVKNVAVYTDSAFLLPSDDTKAKKLLNSTGIRLEDCYISVVLAKPWDTEKEKDQVARYEDFLEGCVQVFNEFMEEHRDVHLLFIPFFYPGDKELAEIIIKRLKKPTRTHLIDVCNQPRVAKALIKNSSLLIGMRFHSIVFAVSTAVPVAAISYGPKSDSLLRKSGMSKYSVRLGIRKNEFFKSVEDIDFKEFFKKLNESWKNRETIREKLKGYVKLMEKNVHPIGEVAKNVIGREDG
jgi:polysaccharide pyruvyl transferase CsaB